MNLLKENIQAKKAEVDIIVTSVPAHIIWRNINQWNNFDNEGQNDDPNTEWNNWVNWDQDPHPFDNSSDDD